MTQSIPGAKTAPATESMSKKRFVLVFGALVLAMFVSSVSESIAATALPTIAGDLHGVEIMQWVSTSYILTSSITMPIYGKLGDMLGRKYLLMSTLVLYAAGKVLCGIAGDMGTLIAGRCISGLGGGGIPVLAQACVSDLIPPRKLGVYLGIMGAILTMSMVLGPILGGWFVQVTGWRWIFWFTVPLALVSVIPLGIFLHQKPLPKHPDIDWQGIVFLAVATTAFVLTSALSGSAFAWISTPSIALIVLFVAATLLFLRAEKRAREPIIPIDLFRNRNFNLCSIVGFLINIGIMGVITYLPTYYQLVDGMAPTVAGLMYTPMAFGTLATSTLSGYLASRTDRYKWMPITMSLVAALGFYLLSTLRIGDPDWISILYLTILGAGLGMGLQILTLIVQNEFSHTLVGTATGANRFFRQIGSTLGAALVGTMFTSRLTADLADKLPKADHISLASLTPQVVDKLPVATRELIGKGYSEALVPLFAIFIPIALTCFVLTLFIQQHPLATSVNHKGTGSNMPSRS